MTNLFILSLMILSIDFASAFILCSTTDQKTHLSIYEPTTFRPFNQISLVRKGLPPVMYICETAQLENDGQMLTEYKCEDGFSSNNNLQVFLADEQGELSASFFAPKFDLEVDNLTCTKDVQ